MRARALGASVFAATLVVSFGQPAFAAGHLGQRTLSDGDYGSDVTELQEDLETLGYNPGSSDGNFGPKTEKAVRSFQGAFGLSVDGIVGSETATALENAVAAQVAANANAPAPATPAPATPAPTTPGAPSTGPFAGTSSSRVMGVDVSKYEGTIDWPRVAANGVTFAFARVSDGLQSPDSTFATNWAGIRNVGLIRGAYQYFRASEDAVAQADYICDRCGALLPGDLAPALDLETQDGQSTSTVCTKIRQWITEVKQRTGLTPIIYVTKSFWSQIGATDNEGCDLWVANWGVSTPKIPSSWSDWAFWQYKGDSASVPGIPAQTDLNYFHGTQQDLINYAYRSPSAAPAPTPTAPTPTTPTSPAPAPQPTPAPSSGPVLSSGDTGAAVVTLQNALVNAGYSVGTVDGDFGAKTKAAVEAFQKAHGLSVDGIVGSATRAALGI